MRGFALALLLAAAPVAAEQATWTWTADTPEAARRLAVGLALREVRREVAAGVPRDEAVGAARVRLADGTSETIVVQRGVGHEAEVEHLGGGLVVVVQVGRGAEADLALEPGEGGATVVVQVARPRPPQP